MESSVLKHTLGSSELLNKAIKLICKSHNSGVAIDPSLQSQSAASSAAPTMDDDLRAPQATFHFPNQDDNAFMEDVEFDNSHSFLSTKHESGPPHHDKEDKWPRLNLNPLFLSVDANVLPSATSVTPGSSTPTASVSTAPAPPAPTPSPSQPFPVSTDGSNVAYGASSQSAAGSSSHSSHSHRHN
ncbi:hypothetical protein K435DRAFT_850773 [Dendrothele bispora CBS 962.96]|uniref:Uncharacterized protein n=1 Tax=Dendrothele bispora (strain CBS 962.96) TaxID=1314807 RepID=A0A4S8MNG8_DENBC|nr:hypothetical protein K435DRAFT_850773 [Dendrothele bispora CBS 962.96]